MVMNNSGLAGCASLAIRDAFFTKVAYFDMWEPHWSLLSKPVIRILDD